jgi:hypothetical protein
MKEKLILHCYIRIPKIKIIQLTSCDMDKKNLKIPKRLSKSVYRRTDMINLRKRENALTTCIFSHRQMRRN